MSNQRHTVEFSNEELRTVSVLLDAVSQLPALEEFCQRENVSHWTISDLREMCAAALKCEVDLDEQLDSEHGYCDECGTVRRLYGGICSKCL